MKTTGIQPAIGVGISALFLFLVLLDACLNSFSKDAYKIVGVSSSAQSWRTSSPSQFAMLAVIGMTFAINLSVSMVTVHRG
ncbi:hypothetical protein AAHC03_01976 [Spirometra sp. Aus1]